MVATTKQSEVRAEPLIDWAAGQDGVSTAEMPPSERDFLVFEAVAFGGSSTRQAAAEFGVSQTRIMQIRRHVAQWIARSVPEGLDLTPMQRLRLAAHIAEGRVDFLYSQALEAWRASQKPLTSECRGRLPGEPRTPRDSHGDPRYLLAASRISLRQLELAGKAHKVMVEVQGSKFKVPSSKLEADASLTHQVGTPLQSLGQLPPVRDCSAEVLEPAVSAVETAEPVNATSGSADVCNEMEQRRQAFLAALEDDTASVHPPFTDAGGMLLDSSLPQMDGLPAMKANGSCATALLDEPATISFSLNRKERRKRQRILARQRRAK
jgi:hypothetical protein